MLLLLLFSFSVLSFTYGWVRRGGKGAVCERGSRPEQRCLQWLKPRRLRGEARRYEQSGVFDMCYVRG